MRVSIGAALLQNADVARTKRLTTNCSKCMRKNTSLSLLLSVIHILTYTVFAATRSLFYSQVIQGIDLLDLHEDGKERGVGGGRQLQSQVQSNL